MRENCYEFYAFVTMLLSMRVCTSCVFVHRVVSHECMYCDCWMCVLLDIAAAAAAARKRKQQKKKRLAGRRRVGGRVVKSIVATRIGSPGEGTAGCRKDKCLMCIYLESLLL